MHFLRSDANSRTMSVLGDASSFFHFHHSAIDVRDGDSVADAPFGTENARLDSVLLVGDVPYHWHRLTHVALPG